MTIDERGRRVARSTRSVLDASRFPPRHSVATFERYRARRHRVQRVGAGLVAAAIGLAVVGAAALILRQPAPRLPAAPFPGGTILFGDWNPAQQRASWYTMRSDGSELTDLGIVATCAEWLSGSQEILITNDMAVDRGRPLRPAVVAPDGSMLRELDAVRDPTLQLGCGDVAPKGSRLVLEGFGRDDTRVDGIYSVRASDGGDLVRLTTGSDNYPQYSPDGSRIVFQRTRAGVVPDGAGALFVLNAGGGPAMRITPWGSAFLDQSWSPDGEWIVFQRPYGQLFLVRPDGTDLHRVPIRLPEGSGATEPSWSPDGGWIVFALLDGGSGEIYAVRPDGSGLRRVSDALDRAAAPDWG